MAYYNEFEAFGDRQAAIADTGESITYAQLGECAGELGQAAGGRCLVFCFCSNTIGSLCGYLGFLHSGIVPLMLDAQIDDTLSANLIEVYQPDYLYVPDAMREKYASLPAVYENHGYCLLKTAYKTAAEELYPELALLLTTSGSTGSPKLVRQSYTNIQANAASIVEYLELDETERPITTLPMNYTYGLSIINSHVQVGATLLLTTRPILAKEFWDFCKQQQATSFGGVPYTYEMLKRIRFFRMDLPALRTMTQAGGKLPVELHKEFAQYAQEKGKHFVVMYGQTEATARMAYLPHDMALEKYGSMGKAIPGGKFILGDVNGAPITQPGVVGELIYEGANVTLGYAEQKSDLAKGDERGGRLETGDMAQMDEDGYFFIVGRKKRFLKLFGNRINLDEIERIVKSEFEQMDAVAGGTDEQMVVYITDAERREAVAALLAERTHINGRAIRVEFIDEVPRNEAGKVLYKLLP